MQKLEPYKKALAATLKVINLTVRLEALPEGDFGSDTKLRDEVLVLWTELMDLEDQMKQ